MAAEGVTVKITGLAELKRAFNGLPDKLRNKVLVKALRAGGRVVQKAARQAVPILAEPGPYRTKGLLRRKLSVRVSKSSKRAGDVGVFVNVKPLKGGGAKNKLDPYYWRFVAFGTKAHTIKPKTAHALAFGGGVIKQVHHPGSKASNFMQAGADALPAALTAFEQAIVPDINALNRLGG